ncbi:HAD hydrolase family protein [Enterococcus faecalis]|nr:HAD hydrolase family protein [Enterococcus faecalis]
MKHKYLLGILLLSIVGISACSKNKTSENRTNEPKQSISIPDTVNESSEKENSYDSTLSKDSSKSTGESKDTTEIDTLNLTSKQAISWVKNYLIQQGANPNEAGNEFQVQFSAEGYLEIYKYSWSPAHTVKTISNKYRINEQGVLQIGNNTGNGEPWETISTTYIGD